MVITTSRFPAVQGILSNTKSARPAGKSSVLTSRTSIFREGAVQAHIGGGVAGVLFGLALVSLIKMLDLSISQEADPISVDSLLKVGVVLLFTLLGSLGGRGIHAIFENFEMSNGSDN